jgi:hypothetical protein
MSVSTLPDDQGKLIKFSRSLRLSLWLENASIFQLILIINTLVFIIVFSLVGQSPQLSDLLYFLAIVFIAQGGIIFLKIREVQRRKLLSAQKEAK